MKPLHILTGRVVRLSLLAVFLAGCSATPVDYRPASEIPEGPGMFSGEEGAFTLYSDENKAKASEESREYRDFLEFKRWKESAKESAEFREFQDWREWKQRQAK